MSSFVLPTWFAFLTFTCCDAKLVFMGIEPCKVEANTMQDGFALAVKFDSTTMSADGTLKTPFDIDDSIRFETTAEKIVDGKYVPDDFELQGSLCMALSIYLPNVAEMLANNIHVKELCPLPPGEYKMKKFSIDADKTGLPEVDAGSQYRLKTIYKKDDAPISCVMFELKTV